MKRPIHHFVIISGLIFLPLSAPLAETTDMTLGKQLHDAHCLACHTPDIYTREHRIVTSFAELAERVRQCELTNELTWFDEEIDAVTGFLNDTYYKFETD